MSGEPSRDAVGRWTVKAIATPGDWSRGYAILVLSGLLAISWLLSYVLGGAGRAPPHWFYVPILVAAARFGLPGAAAAAIIAGLLAGPLLPLDVRAGSSQPFVDWTARLGFFLGIGLLMAAVVVRLKGALGRELALAEAERDLAARQSSFIGTVSHELRTPLTVIRGVAETLLDQSWVSAQGRPLLESLQRANVRLEELVGAMLAVVEAEQLRGELLDLSKVGERVAHELDHLGASRRVRIADAPQGRLVRTDRNVVRQVLRHVLENALKFSEDIVEVTVSASRTGAEVRVRDFGPGISAQFVDKAFEPFTQAEDWGTREHGGLGLGLFLARQLAARIGGSISLATGVDGGTEVVLKIPDIPSRTDA